MPSGTVRSRRSPFWRRQVVTGAHGGIRLPDFCVIGVMKSGTTSLFRWLGTHPDCSVPHVKEPNFFSYDRAWHRGIDRYARLFAAIDPALRTGEASVSYTAPDFAERAAQRLSATMPDARLICIVRHPLERTRSHYRHAVQRGRERQTFLDAVSSPRSPYLARSRYDRCLEPWLERFGTAKILIIRFEDLFGEDSQTWSEVLCHIGLRDIPRPVTTHNVTQGKPLFTPLMRWLWDRGLVQSAERKTPRVLRRVARPALLRDNSHNRLLKSAELSPPPRVIADLRSSTSLLEERLGRTDPLWNW